MAASNESGEGGYLLKNFCYIAKDLRRQCCGFPDPGKRRNEKPVGPDRGRPLDPEQLNLYDLLQARRPAIVGNHKKVVLDLEGECWDSEESTVTMASGSQDSSHRALSQAKQFSLSGHRK
jgi:hypothetical protein